MYKTVAGDQERVAVLEPKIHGDLKPLVTKSSDENREMVKKMAVELTKWIEDGTEGNKLEAAKRILKTYLNGSTELRLSGLELTSLPECIAELRNLKSLDLGCNQLISLPDGIGGFGNLRTLSLSDNQLRELPDWIGELRNLEQLHLDNNQLTTVPSEIGLLTSLKELDLRCNYLPQTESEKLPEHKRARGVGEQKTEEDWRKDSARVQEKLKKINKSIANFKKSSESKAEEGGSGVEATLTGLPVELKELILNRLPKEKLQMMGRVNREFKGLSRQVYLERLEAEQTKIKIAKGHLIAIGIANRWLNPEDQVVAG